MSSLKWSLHFPFGPGLLPTFHGPVFEHHVNGFSEIIDGKLTFVQFLHEKHHFMVTKRLQSYFFAPIPLHKMYAVLKPKNATSSKKDKNARNKSKKSRQNTV